MRTPEQVKVSEHVSDRVRLLRIAHSWEIPQLADELLAHRCDMHPDGYKMSDAVLGTIERGTYAQHGYEFNTRAITVDELVVFAHVFEVPVEDLLF